MIERGGTTNPEAEINNQIFQTVDSFFTLNKELPFDYEESPEEIKQLFSKVDNLLDNHGEIESYRVKKEAKNYPKKINHRTLSFNEEGCFIRFFEEKDEEEKNKINIRIEERRNWHSLVIRLQEDTAAIHYGMEGFHEFSKVELDKTVKLVDLLEKKKIEKEKKPEYQKQIKIKNFFKELGEVAYGDVPVSVFKKFTDDETWELSGANLIGEIENSTTIMVLRKYTGGYAQAILEVFRSRTDINKGPGEVRFMAGSVYRGLNLPLSVAYNFKSETYHLSDKFSKLLIDVAEEIKSAYEESRKK